MSGHIFYADRWYGFDDALYVAVRLLGIVARMDGKLSAVRRRAAAGGQHAGAALRLRRHAQVRGRSRRSPARLRAAGADVNDIDGVRVLTAGRLVAAARQQHAGGAGGPRRGARRGRAGAAEGGAGRAAHGLRPAAPDFSGENAGHLARCSRSAARPARHARGRGRHARPCCSTSTRSSTTSPACRRCWRRPAPGCGRTPRPTNRPWSPTGRSPRRRRPMRAEGRRGRGAGLGRRARHPGQQRGGRRRASWRGFAALAGIATVAVCADDAGQRRRRIEAAAEAAGRAPDGAGRDRRRHGALRRAAGAGGGGAGRARSPASQAPALRRPAGLSRPRPALPHARRSGRARSAPPSTTSGGRSSSCASRGWTARSSAAPAPARSSSRRRAASTPRSRPAAIASWTPITPATRAAPRPGSGTRCSCWRP